MEYLFGEEASKIKVIKYNSLGNNDCYFFVTEYKDGYFSGQGIPAEELKWIGGLETAVPKVGPSRISLDVWEKQEDIKLFTSLSELNQWLN